MASDRLLIDAIRNRTVIEFVYDGARRYVEPHAFGADDDGALKLRGWQHRGLAGQRVEDGWRLYFVADMHDVQLTPQSFDRPRPGYRQGDKAFATIRAQL